ncbi:MAG: SPFH domain-containing protein [Labilithrix sp.]|nr:SPFH domain-containing protein [Labilithrix sp.]MBX3217047.1 SPFH domain-containing protein [Labilithrix sp.]
MDPASFLGLAVAAFGAAVVAFGGLRQVNQWETALKFTLGKFAGRAGPGLNFVFPGVQRMVRIDMRVRNRDLPQQAVITADNVTAWIDAVIYYKVVDAEKATLNVQDYEHAVRDRAKVVLRDVVGETSLDELLAHRDEIAAKVRAAVEQFVAQWGLHVELIALQDIQLPQQMQEVIAKKAIAERDRQYVVIKSQADLESAKNFAEAARILHQSPGAMELRRLEALQNLSHGTSKVIFDLAKPQGTSETQAAAVAAALGGSVRVADETREGDDDEAAPAPRAMRR